MICWLLLLLLLGIARSSPVGLDHVKDQTSCDGLHTKLTTSPKAKLKSPGLVHVSVHIKRSKAVFSNLGIQMALPYGVTLAEEGKAGHKPRHQPMINGSTVYWTDISLAKTKSLALKAKLWIGPCAPSSLTLDALVNYVSNTLMPSCSIEVPSVEVSPGC